MQKKWSGHGRTADYGPAMSSSSKLGRRCDVYMTVTCRFVVLRTTILVTEKEAEKMTDMLYTILTHRIVTMVLKQQSVHIYDSCPLPSLILRELSEKKLLASYTKKEYNSCDQFIFLHNLRELQCTYSVVPAASVFQSCRGVPLASFFSRAIQGDSDVISFYIHASWFAAPPCR